MEPYTGTMDVAAGLLSMDVFREIKRECVADILIGIPTYNNARTIGAVLQTVRTGLTLHFPDLKAILLNSDGGSTDGTPAIVRNSVARRLPVYLSRHRERSFLAQPDPFHPVPGRSAALRTIFETAEELNVRSCVILEGDLTSITPEWIKGLVTPVIKDQCDYVSPLYRRNKCDSMITNTFLYPLTRALYGKRVQQPIGGNFCVSGALAGFYLRKLRARPRGSDEGIDIRLATEAIAKGFKNAEVFLGPRLRSTPGACDVNSALPWIAGAAFDLIEAQQSAWIPVSGSMAVPVFGACGGPATEQREVEVDGMLAVFRQGVRHLKDIWMRVLGAADYGLLEYLAFRPEGRFHITPTLWASIVYAYALAYHKRSLSTGHLLKSFIPLYLGKAASHLQEILDKGQREAEDEIERICIAFEEGKKHLVRNWSV